MANISNIDFIKIGIDQNGVVHYVNASGAWDILPLGGSGDCCGGTIEAEGNVTIESTGGSVGVDAANEINIEAVNNATLQSLNGNVELNSPNGNVVVNGVKVYKAMLNQTVTNAPVATVLENSLGGTVVFTYIGVGIYRGTLVGAFPSKGRFFSIIAQQAPFDSVAVCSWSNVDSFTVETSSVAGIYSNNKLDETSILIEVYP